MTAAGRSGRRARRATAALLAITLAGAAACAQHRSKPDLSDGVENVYAFLSRGSRAVADGMLQDRWDLGNRYPVVTMPEITWTEDPFNDEYWRFLFYSLRPTAHLLAAYMDTGLPKYRDKLLSILSSFAAYDAARPPTPPYDRTRLDYRHGAAFRALVLVNTLRKLERAGEMPADLDASLKAAIRRLGVFLAREENFDTYNHGYTEAAGLAVIARNFPEFPESGGWMEIALRRLDELMIEAVDPDGVEVENSPFYHFYVLSFAYQIDRWATRYGVGISPHYHEATLRMVDYATRILQPDGHVPLLGASVEVGLENLDDDIYAQLAETDPQFAWVYTQGARGAAPAGRARLYPASGQCVLRSGYAGGADALAESHVTFNVGPWRSEHNHLDVLGVTMFSAGQRLLCDSGLFTYDDGVEKAYFYSTAAHNTVVVDGADQSQLGYVTEGLSASGDRWAYQSGAHGLYGGVVHRRGVLLLERDLLLVVDAIDADAAHDFAQVWHLPVGFAPQIAGAAVDAGPGETPVIAIRQALADGLSLQAISGATAPMQGWISEGYGQRDPAYALEYHLTGTTARLVTLVATGPLARGAPAVRAAFDADGTLRATVCGGTAPLDVAVASLAGPGEAVSVTPASGACP